jgi:hypothetical protein
MTQQRDAFDRTKGASIMRYLPALLLAVLVFPACGDSSGTGDDTATDDGGTNEDAVTNDDAATTHDADAPEETTVDPDLLSIEDLAYLGAFRVSSDDFGVSNSNYAVGTLGFNPENNSLFLAGHAQHNAVAEFAIPGLGTATDVPSLPIVETPLQPFTALLDASPHGNPEAIDRVTGLFCIDGSLIVNAELWYDAAGTARDTTLLVRDADALGGTVDGYFELDGAAHAGGYMAAIPEEWRTALGGTHLVGWASNYSIVSRYSVGPSLFVFDPLDVSGSSAGAEGPIATRVWTDFPHAGEHYLGADALTTVEGSAPALWNFLSRAVYAFIVPGTRTFAAFGSSGGVDSGIGYKIVQDDGNECGGYCAYHADDYYNYYWFFDLDDILAASEPYEPRPYAFGRWSVPFDDGGEHRIIGGTFDESGRVLYLSLDAAGQVGDYDRPPVIVAFRVLP